MLACNLGGDKMTTMSLLLLPSSLLRPPPTTTTTVPFSSQLLLLCTRRRNSSRPVVAAAATRGKVKDLVLGNPSVTVEKGKYSYDVETLINKLSSLPPRGSIARCLESFRQRLSLSDFALVFKEFAGRGDWQRSLRLFKYMQRQVWCRPDEHIHAILIGLLGRESLLDKALDVFKEMASPTALSYTALINAFARNGDHSTALSLLSQMKAERIPPTALTYNTVLRAAARASLPWDALLGLFAEMRHDAGVHPDLTTYNTLIAAAGARGLPDQAEMVFRSMLDAGVLPDQSTHAYLVQAFSGRLSLVSHLLGEMEAAGRLPDPSAYNVLIEAHARAGESAEALAVLRQMQSAGCTPNAATYSILLGLYGRTGRYEDVRDLFLEMKVIGTTQPDCSTYNILIRVFGEGGYFKEVVTLFRDMVDEDVEPNMETYETLIAACGKGGLHNDAKTVLSHMNAKGVVPSSKAYTGVVEACGQAALYEEALVAFNTMHEIGSNPTIETYNSLLSTFARGGLFKESQALLSRMSGGGIQRDGDSFNAAIQACCQGGQFEDALKAYVEMQKSRCNPNERTLEAILNVYSNAGLVEESKEQFQEIESAGITPSIMAYCMMISVCARNDRWDDVYQLLEEMKTSRISNSHQVIGSMMKGDYDDESNWQMVEYVFDVHNAVGCGFGLRFYKALLEALWWLGQRERAARVLSEATKRGLFPELYRESKLVWSVDVHRMSVGGALTAISVWLNVILERFKKGEDLPHLASVVVVRGEMEKNWATRELPVAKAAYSFLRDKISPSFQFPSWNKGRIVCHRTQLKRILSAETESKEGMIPIINSDFPLPGTLIYTAESDNDNASLNQEDEMGSESESEAELMQAAAV